MDFEGTVITVEDEAIIQPVQCVSQHEYDTAFEQQSIINSKVSDEIATMKVQIVALSRTQSDDDIRIKKLERYKYVAQIVMSSILVLIAVSAIYQLFK